MRLEHYMVDGACAQAKAVLAFLQSHDSLVESSWDDEWKAYRAEPKIARWENGRERGYVLYMPSVHAGKQLNIAFYEYRSSDSLCAQMWESNVTMNPPTLKDAPENSWDDIKWMSYGEVLKMARWIQEQVETFWKANLNEPTIGQKLAERREKAKSVVEQYVDYINKHTYRESMESASTDVIARFFGVSETEAYKVLKKAADKGLITHLDAVGGPHEWIQNSTVHP